MNLVPFPGVDVVGTSLAEEDGTAGADHDGVVSLADVTVVLLIGRGSGRRRSQEKASGARGRLRTTPTVRKGGVVFMNDVQDSKVLWKAVDIDVQDECRNGAFPRADDGHTTLHHPATGRQFSNAS